MIEGWKKIRIRGDPYERGFTHGFLLAKELRMVKRILSFMIREFLKMDVHAYMKRSKDEIYPIVKNRYPEFYKELRGISAGARSTGVNISVALLIAWNSVMSIYPNDLAPNRCSAFMPLDRQLNLVIS